MKLTKLDKKQNRYFIDTTKNPVFITGARAIGKAITKLAMYESLGEPSSISNMLKASREVLTGEGFTPAQAKRAAAECESSAEKAAQATADYIIKLLKDKYSEASEFIEKQLKTEEHNGI